MLLLGMMVSALIYGALLEHYTPGRLVQIIQGTAVITVALNLCAMWKQEARNRERAQEMKVAKPLPFKVAFTNLAQTEGMIRLLIVICLGTFGFGMADVLLEPYGGQALGLSVASTTKLTALFAGGTLIGFAIASRLLSQTSLPHNVALAGIAFGIPGFGAIIFASLDGGTISFLIGTFLVGVGAGLFGHATLTATMRAAPREQVGLALGAWGAAQATSAGLGVALAGVVRDLVVGLQGATGNVAQTPYNIVFTIEIISLAAAVLVIWPLLKKTTKRNIPSNQAEAL